MGTISAENGHFSSAISALAYDVEVTRDYYAVRSDSISDVNRRTQGEDSRPRDIPLVVDRQHNRPGRMEKEAS